jgi:hypothetical protein
LNKEWEPDRTEPAEVAGSSETQVQQEINQVVADQPASKPKAPSTKAALSIPSRATAAAYELLQKGEPVTVAAVATLAGLDRSHLYKKYPQIIKLIHDLGAPDRELPRGLKDSEGNLEAWSEDD